MPKVSVIIPVYNVEQYLRICLDSVVDQTLEDIEIICVDDGSTDNCGTILDEYAQKDDRIKVIHQKNKGLSGARNTGIRAVTGDYLTYIDSDDFVEKDYLSTMYNFAKKYNADITVAQMKFFNDENVSDAAMYHSGIICSELYDKLAFIRNDKQSFWTSVVNKLYSKNLIEQLKNYPNPDELNLGEDCLWMVKTAYFANMIVGTTGSYYYYRYNQSSITHTDSEKNNKDKDCTIKEVIKFMKDFKFPYNCMEVVLLNCVYHRLFDKSQYLYFISKICPEKKYNEWLLKLALYLTKLKTFVLSGRQKQKAIVKYQYIKQLNKIISQSENKVDKIQFLGFSRVIKRRKK